VVEPRRETFRALGLNVDPGSCAKAAGLGAQGDFGGPVHPSEPSEEWPEAQGAPPDSAPGALLEGLRRKIQPELLGRRITPPRWAPLGKWVAHWGQTATRKTPRTRRAAPGVGGFPAISKMKTEAGQAPAGPCCFQPLRRATDPRPDQERASWWAKVGAPGGGGLVASRGSRRPQTPQVAERHWAAPAGWRASTFRTFHRAPPFTSSGSGTSRGFFPPPLFARGGHHPGVFQPSLAEGDVGDRPGAASTSSWRR